MGEFPDEIWDKVAPGIFAKIKAGEKKAHDFCVRVFLTNGHAFNVVVSANNRAEAFDKAGQQTSSAIARFKLMWEGEQA
jgi:hypothetical protein